MEMRIREETILSRECCYIYQRVNNRPIRPRRKETDLHLINGEKCAEREAIVLWHLLNLLSDFAVCVCIRLCICILYFVCVCVCAIFTIDLLFHVYMYLFIYISSVAPVGSLHLRLNKKQFRDSQHSGSPSKILEAPFRLSYFPRKVSSSWKFR